MDNKNSENLRKSTRRMAIWAVIALLAIGGVTYAWFSFTSATNVTPMAGAIGSGGAELLISATEDGEFGPYADLIVEGTGDKMYPVSTANLDTWSTSVSNNGDGICVQFIDVTENIDDKTLHGKLYLKSVGGDSVVFFNRDEMSFGDNNQLIASCRLGIKGTSESDEQFQHIYKLDSLGTGALERATMDESNVVIESVDGVGNPITVQDPSIPIEQSSGYYSEDTTYPGETPICFIKDGEVVGIDFRIYMEGCDENCYNEAQDMNIDLKMAFVGVEAPKEIE